MRHSLIYAIYLPTLILSFCRGMLIPVLPLYVASFDVSYGWIGLVLAADGIGTLVGDIPTGILIGRIGRKRSMLVGLFCIALAILALSWARSLPELLLYQFIGGLGGALWNISRHAYITGATPTNRRGRAIAVFGGISRLGVLAGPVVGGALATGFGLRAPFILYAGLALLALLFPLFFATRGLPGPVQHRGGWKGHSGYIWQILQSHYRILITAGSGQLFAQAIRSGRQIIVPLFAADMLGMDALTIGWVVSVSAALDVSMFYPAGLIMDRLGRKAAYVPSFLIQAVGMALIPFSSGFASLLLATGLLGFGNGLGSGTMMTLGADLAPEEAMDEFLGIWRLIGDGGQITGPMVVGSVADLVGLSTATFAVAGFGLLAAAVLGLLVPETLHQRHVGAPVRTPPSSH